MMAIIERGPEWIRLARRPLKRTAVVPDDHRGILIVTGALTLAEVLTLRG
jgi:hypothetical protein